MKGLFFKLTPGKVLSLSGILIMCACSQGTAPQGHYQATPIVADGQADDWPQPLRFTNPRHTYSFNITNDNRNLYVCIMTKDDRMQRRILKAGMDVFFDQKGQENHDIDLSYPESNTADALSSPDSASSKHALLTAATTFNTSGFLNIENGQFSKGDKACPIKVALALHADSTLVYEAVVPLYTVLKRGGLDPKTLKKDFSVGIVIGALPETHTSNRPAQNNNYHPHMGMSMGPMGMGMGHGGGYGGNRNYNNQPAKPQNEAAWYTFKFAQK